MRQYFVALFTPLTTEAVHMAGTDKRKQSLYFPENMLQEIQHEAARLDRSLSWIVQRCVKLGLTEVKKLPSVNDVADDMPEIAMNAQSPRPSHLC